MLMKHHLTSVTFKGFDESYFFVFNKQNTICAQIYIIITGTCWLILLTSRCRFVIGSRLHYAYGGNYTCARRNYIDI